MSALLILHAVLGGVALLSGGVAIGSRKGAKLHRRAGVVFFWTMVSALCVIVPRLIATGNVFLSLLVPFSLYLLGSGYRAPYRRPGSRAGLQKLDRAMAGMGLVGSVCLAAFGAYRVFGNGDALGLPLVAVVLGTIGARVTWADLISFSAPPLDFNGRVRSHVGSMLGAYIAATTAFSAVNVPSDVVPVVLIWLTPTALGVPLMIWFQRHYPDKALRT